MYDAGLSLTIGSNLGFSVKETLTCEDGPDKFSITLVHHLSREKRQPMIGRGSRGSVPYLQAKIYSLYNCLIWHSDHQAKSIA